MAVQIEDWELALMSPLPPKGQCGVALCESNAVWGEDPDAFDMEYLPATRCSAHRSSVIHTINHS